MTAQIDDLIHRLSSHRLLAPAPVGEIRWLAERGTLRSLETGYVLATPSQELEGLDVVLSGHLAIHVKRGGVVRKQMEWRAGDLTGLLPYSRLKTPPGSTVALEPTDLFVLQREHFPALIRECHEITSICVHVMLDRARHFTTTDFHDEKMFSLGKLAAGLAHELNNPASAVARSADALPGTLRAMDRAARELAATTLTEAQIKAIDDLHTLTSAHTSPSYRPALERADDEEALATWLADRRIDEEPAEVLADVPRALAALQRAESVLDRARLETVVEYIAAEYSAARLAGDIARAATRISRLVTAVKRFTYLDQAGVPKPIDIVAGLQDTILMFGAKARSKSVTVGFEATADVPRIDGFGGELNQVWTNLLDNALDAVPAGGRVDVGVACSNGQIAVSITDNGPGIPDAVRHRVFDPFFTTKPVGEGTGLGLDIARRIVRRHDGDIELSSSPGRTEFRVMLPIRHADAVQDSAGSQS